MSHFQLPLSTSLKKIANLIENKESSFYFVFNIKNFFKNSNVKTF